MRYEEFQIQIAVVSYIRANYPDVLFTCAPAAARSVQQGVRNKRLGLRKGWSDLFLAEPKGGFHGLFIELKAEGGKKEDSQKEFIASAKAKGYCAEFCVGYQEAVDLIERYMKG